MELNRKLVTLRRNVRDKGVKIADKNWVLTAYDINSADDVNSAMASKVQGKAAPATESAGKGNNNLPTDQTKGGKIVKGEKQDPKVLNSQAPFKTKDTDFFSVGNKPKDARIPALAKDNLMYKGGYVATTDAYILLAKKVYYDAKYEGKVVNRQGEIVKNETGGADAQVPDFLAIRPKNYENSIERKTLNEYIQRLDYIKRNSTPSVFKNLNVVFETPYDNTRIFANASKLYTFLNYSLHNNLKVLYQDAVHAIYGEGEDAFAGVMHIKGDKVINTIDITTDRLMNIDTNEEYVPQKLTESYTTKKGAKVAFKSLLESEDVSYKAENGNPKLDKLNKLRKLEEGEICNVERRFTERKEYDFFGKEKIETLDDVAYIFKNLEDEAIENTFIVAVKNKRPTIIHTGIGNMTIALLDVSPLVRVLDNIKPDEVYFVHNHPSGNLRPSDSDEYVYNRLAKMTNYNCEGIIINGYSGDYSVFTSTKDYTTLNMNNNRSIYSEYPAPNDVKHGVYSYSKNVFNAPLERIPEPLSPNSIAEFINTQRLGSRDKVNVLFLNNHSKCVGNTFLPITDLRSDVKTIARSIVSDGTAMGATSAIIYGSGNLIDMQPLNLSNAVKSISGETITLLDVIQIESSHRSYMDYGVSFNVDMDSAIISDDMNYIAKKELLQVFTDAVNGDLKGKGVQIGKLTKDGKSALEKLSGVNFKDDVSFVFNPSDLLHIYRNHFGANEKDLSRNIPLNENDIANIIDVINEPTNIVYLGKNEGDRFAFLKDSKNGAYNLIEVYTTRRGNLSAKTFYKTKKDASHRAITLLKKSQNTTSEMNGAILSGANIPKLFDLTNLGQLIGDSEKDNTLYKVSTQQDADYLGAVKRGDMKTAQKMVDEAVKEAMPNTKVVDEKGNPLVVYHGTNWKVMEEKIGKAVFDNSKGESHSAIPTDVYFFTSSRDNGLSYTENANFDVKQVPIYKESANSWIDENTEKITLIYSAKENEPIVVDKIPTNLIDVKGNLKKGYKIELRYIYKGNGTWYSRQIPLMFSSVVVNSGQSVNINKLNTELNDGFSDYVAMLLSGQKEENLINAYINLTNPIVIDYSGDLYRESNPYGKDIYDTIDYAKEHGYDGIILKNIRDGHNILSARIVADDVIAFSPNQIKSADPITYDDNGNVIPLSERFNEVEDDIRFKIDDSETSAIADEQVSFKVADKERAEWFENEPKIKVYQSAMKIDGKYYPAVNTYTLDANGNKVLPPEIKLKVVQEAEEHPERIAKEGRNKGKFPLKRAGENDMWVAYNPYGHFIREMLNDQFTAAHRKPELVLLETLIPASELTSGYRAEGAKNTTGEMPWREGPVSSQLHKLGRPRKVILSRWWKPIGEVDPKDVALGIKEMLDGTGITMPINVVTPQVREELHKIGVKFSAIKGSVGQYEEGLNKILKSYNEPQGEDINFSVEAERKFAQIKRGDGGIDKTNPAYISLKKKLESELGVHITEYVDPNRKRGYVTLGTYNTVTGEVKAHINNIYDINTFATTIIHEVVGHKGLIAAS